MLLLLLLLLLLWQQQKELRRTCPRWSCLQWKEAEARRRRQL